MTAAALHPDEYERVALLRLLDLLDSPPEPVFDHITRLVARTLQVPIATITLVDSNRQWFKSKVGLEVQGSAREYSFCAHTILSRKPMVIPDATLDPRFTDNPLVTGEPYIRFYAGVPICSKNGLQLGSLCAIDSQPRLLRQDELETLVDLAALVSLEIQKRESLLLARKRLNNGPTNNEASEARFRSIFERAGLGIALVAPDDHWLSANDALCKIVGYSQAELASLTVDEITYAPDLAADQRLSRQLVNGEIDHYQLEKRYVKKQGETVWVDIHVTRQVDQEGTLAYFVSLVQNIQARKEAEADMAALRRDLEQRVEERTQELTNVNAKLSTSMAQQLGYQQALRRRETELSAVIENASDAYICIDEAGYVTDWNRQAQDTFGWMPEEALGRKLEELIIPPAMREMHRAGMQQYLSSGQHTMLNRRMELPALRRDGSSLMMEVRIQALDLGDKKIFSAFLHDITERKREEATRKFEARHDALTGLPNRRALFEMLPMALARANRNGTAAALLFLDLDGFKAVNDTWGHEAGDSLLQEIARRLSAGIRTTDAVARLGGDEFIVLLENLSDANDAARVVSKKLQANIALPIQLSGTLVQVSASIGITLHLPGAEMSADQFIKAADSAMYQAKQAGKSTPAALTPLAADQ